MAILDNETDSALMVMELDAYEKMIEKPEASEQLSIQPQVQIERLTEEELMEKINKDVALWRASNDKERLEKFDLEEVAVKKSVAQTASHVPQNRLTVEKNMPISQSDRHISRDSQTGVEESAADIVSEEDEEKFYLEPVE